MIRPEKTMSAKTADVLFGSDAPELGELQGLRRRVLAAATPVWAFTALAHAPAMPDNPVLEWDLPCPVWEPADYTVPTA